MGANPAVLIAPSWLCAQDYSWSHWGTICGLGKWTWVSHGQSKCPTCTGPEDLIFPALISILLEKKDYKVKCYMAWHHGVDLTFFIVEDWSNVYAWYFQHKLRLILYFHFRGSYEQGTCAIPVVFRGPCDPGDQIWASCIQSMCTVHWAILDLTYIFEGRKAQSSHLNYCSGSKFYKEI